MRICMCVWVHAVQLACWVRMVTNAIERDYVCAQWIYVYRWQTDRVRAIAPVPHWPRPEIDLIGCYSIVEKGMSEVSSTSTKEERRTTTTKEENNDIICEKVTKWSVSFWRSAAAVADTGVVALVGVTTTLQLRGVLVVSLFYSCIFNFCILFTILFLFFSFVLCSSVLF